MAGGRERERECKLSFLPSLLIRAGAQLFMCVWLFVTPWTVNLPGSSVHGVIQERIVEWVAVSSSRASSWPRDWTLLCLLHCRRVLYLQSHQGSTSKTYWTGMKVGAMLGIGTCNFFSTSLHLPYGQYVCFITHFQQLIWALLIL